jgi:hypothetical protein
MSEQRKFLLLLALNVTFLSLAIYLYQSTGHALGTPFK